ncbi:hypothetical protein E2C01_011677 [Portunus trituberculatus]|uniref:Uncharacterized protein n=1 Tax=Portunus trituberculatus TaxID=210409 RepID=A0A5B7DCK7_PORTR|nr:hypothetical protein [Portunus trituberculatus]
MGIWSRHSSSARSHATHMGCCKRPFNHYFVSIYQPHTSLSMSCALTLPNNLRRICLTPRRGCVLSQVPHRARPPRRDGGQADLTRSLSLHECAAVLGALMASSCPWDYHTSIVTQFIDTRAHGLDSTIYAVFEPSTAKE